MIQFGNHKFGDGKLFIIAGPCLIESEDVVMRTAAALVKLARTYDLPIIFKGSYRKANRLSGKSFAGIGDQEALKLLQKAKSEFGVPVLTDIHETSDAKAAAQVCDVLQIPAFLCRQTDLIVVAAKTGKAVNIKKGQFLAAEDMSHIAQKAVDAGNSNIMLTERGTTFGYRDLIVDFRSLIKMKQTGHLVVFDATHSVQQPGGQGGSSGGNREYVLPLSKAAIAVGVDGLFFEAHPDPAHALSDSATQLPLDYVETYLKEIKRIAQITTQA
ncbi:MAG: 3-deoxy-8-phosphooctulonate synthase [Candidatus Zixiibacteriota bacterium]